MRPVFADPKTDFVFKRIFGAEVHKRLLIELLNALLELDDEHKIVDLKYRVVSASVRKAKIFGGSAATGGAASAWRRVGSWGLTPRPSAAVLALDQAAADAAVVGYGLECA